MIKIAPSILSADFSRLKDEIAAVEAAGADWLHVDVMDGHFVPNITIGPVVVESVRKVTKIPVDVHLMITDPDKYAPAFIKAGADSVSIHPDTCPDPNATLEHIRELGAKCSVAVNPDVPLSKVEFCFDHIDMILMMTVFPGFGGQAFIPDVLPKIAEVKRTSDRSRRWYQNRQYCARGGCGRRGDCFRVWNIQDVRLHFDHPPDAPCD